MGKRHFATTAIRASGCVLLAAAFVAAQAPESPSALPQGWIATPAAAAATAISASRWERYINTRYGVIIDYPADLFAIGPPPPDNAGRGFEAPAARARFSIYSHANALDMSIDELQAEDVLDLGDAAAKKQKGDNWYQVVAVKDDKTVVRRVLLSEENTMIHRLEIAFPMRAGAAFQPIVTRMSESFRVDPSIPEKAAQGGGH